MDSPAQGWGHSHHRHLLTPASSPKTPDQTTLTGCDFQSPLRVPINSRSSRKPGPLCSDMQCPRAQPLWSLFISGDKEAEKQVLSFLESGKEGRTAGWAPAAITALVTRMPCSGAKPPLPTALLPKPMRHLVARLRCQCPSQPLTSKMATNKELSRLHV